MKFQFHGGLACTYERMINKLKITILNDASTALLSKGLLLFSLSHTHKIGLLVLSWSCNELEVDVRVTSCFQTSRACTAGLAGGAPAAQYALGRRAGRCCPARCGQRSHNGELDI